MNTNLYLIRHAQSIRSDSVHFANWPLSKAGESQAKALESILNRFAIDHIYTSPFLRCRQTIEHFARTKNVAPIAIDDLRERHIADGIIDNFFDVWHQSWDDLHFALPGCESSYECQRRMTRSLREIASKHPHENIAISSHGFSIGLFLHAIDPTFDRHRADEMRNPDIIRVRFHQDLFHYDALFHCEELFTIATNQHETPQLRDKSTSM